MLTWLLSLIIFLPSRGGALACASFPATADGDQALLAVPSRWSVFLLTVWLAIPAGRRNAAGPISPWARPGMQNVVCHRWIPAFNIYYFLGIDGISLPLVLLTSFLSMLAMWASWPITKHVKAYCILFLLLGNGHAGRVPVAGLLPVLRVLGSDAAADVLPDRHLGRAAARIRRHQVLPLHAGRQRADAGGHADALFRQRRAHARRQTTCRRPCRGRRRHAGRWPTPRNPVHTFNILALAEMGQLPNSPVHQALLWGGKSLSWWAFLLLFIGFVIKLPAVPVHTWLPDAHVEAPTPISMILAGVLLEDGRLRHDPHLLSDLSRRRPTSWPGWSAALGTVSMVYGALAAMAQKDFKRLVAYSSVSHMGYVLLGIGVWSATAGNALQHRLLDRWA